MKNEFTKPDTSNVVVIDMENFDKYKNNPCISTGDLIDFSNVNLSDGFYNIKFKLGLLSNDNYGYFPFHIEFILSKTRVERYKIDGKNDEYEFVINNIEIKNRSLKLKVISEIFFNAYQSKKGSDDRNLFGYFTEISF